MHGFVFLLIAYAGGVLPGGAHLGLDNSSRLNTTAFPDGKVSKHYAAAEDEHKHDQDDEERANETFLQSMRRVAEKFTSFVRPPATNNIHLTAHASTEEFEKWLARGCMSERRGSDGDIETINFMRTSFGEENTIRFFHWLRDRDGMQRRADVLQQRLLGSGSETAHESLQRLWLEKMMEPEDVFEIVDSWQGGLTLWLEFTELYRKIKGGDKFSVESTLNYLNEAHETDAVWLYGGFFQAMKENVYLKSLGQTMEKLRFDELIREGITPLELSRLITLSENEMEGMRGRRPKIRKAMLAAWKPGYEVIELPADSSSFRALKAYTLQYVATKSIQEVASAKKVFSNGDRDAIRGLLEMLEQQPHVDGKNGLTPSRHYGVEF
ncbi:unnamed protein product [Hyaloperonospora brassicae]|uniref:RxLR effector candidate protein n=1 Tax=Hyaloperonospora brassicae TaxID=162125 RepID=A0AAV0TMN0_HYABA|nr:unnamed protein product [Hyaloperonospora brassicae]